MRLLVVTVVHVPTDARILHRQIRALLDDGWSVTYAAPWTASEQQPPPDLTPIDLPRAAGRRRIGALRAARRALTEHGPGHDLVLLHDPELLLSVRGLTGLPPVVWDVHEDTAAALADKRWVPRWLRGRARAGVRYLERWAEENVHLLLAEDGYAARFRGDPPVVANLPRLPADVADPGDDRVVYLGRVSELRGAHELIAVARRLPPGVTMDVIGPADPDVTADLREAHASGALRWHGYVPNDLALPLLEGAMAGLSLLHDVANYRVSRPTKVLEYLAWGVPVVTTPLPHARALVEPHDAGSVVAFGDVDAVLEAIEMLRSDEALRIATSRRARVVASQNSWEAAAVDFVAQLRAWAAS